jgi:CRISPR/Cas system-associated protein Csx1
MKNKVYATTADTRETQWHEMKHFASEIKTTCGIFKCMLIFFQAKLRCVSVNEETISNTSHKKAKIEMFTNSFFVSFFTSYNLSNSQSTEGATMKVEIKMVATF